jgi:hypothetical protein
MVRSIVTRYLVKIVPAFLLSLLAWRVLHLSVVYHSIVAFALDIAHGLLDPTGAVRGVSVAGGEFVVDLASGAGTTHLKIVADDLTGNAIVLLAFFLASPIRSHVKSFALHLCAALAALVGLHVFAAASNQYALATSGHFLGPVGAGGCGARPLLYYGHFHELIGMYLFPLLLWVPYMARRLMESRRM